jgi:hypothetical protein
MDNLAVTTSSISWPSLSPLQQLELVRGASGRCASVLMHEVQRQSNQYMLDRRCRDTEGLATAYPCRYPGVLLQQYCSLVPRQQASVSARICWSSCGPANSRQIRTIMKDCWAQKIAQQWFDPLHHASTAPSLIWQPTFLQPCTGAAWLSDLGC